MKSKLKIVVPLALVILGATYKLVLAKPAEGPPRKIEGEVYVLPKEFLVNLAGGRFAKLSVALIMKPGAHAAAEGAEAAKPPEGFGPDPQEAVVRDIVTNVLTDADGEDLIAGRGRRRLKRDILEAIHEKTDVHAEEVLFTDVAVQ